MSQYGITIHEFSHVLFGGNNFHTSGGHHYSTDEISTFFGLQGGFGLMGGSFTSLTSCNAYERWRMHWQHSSNQNNNDWWIVARDKNNPNIINNADIKQSDGAKSFILRDFVTYGDAVRIQLPYQDENASKQYIWLENHQVGLNNKIDYLKYSLDHNFDTWHACRPVGTPGIYAYIQVGKDILSGSHSEVYPSNEADNLRIISAVERWLCAVHAEYDLKSGIITPDEFTENLKKCGSALDLISFGDKFSTNNNTKSSQVADNNNLINSIGTEKSTNDFSLIPNPNEGNFSIQLSSSTANSEVRIFNALGQLVETSKISSFGEQTISFNNFAKGQYTVVYIEDGKIINCEKLIVK